jgi:hypothetical protein
MAIISPGKEKHKKSEYGETKGVNSVKLEILIGIKVPAKERIRIGSDDLWSRFNLFFDRFSVRRR